MAEYAVQGIRLQAIYPALLECKMLAVGVAELGALCTACTVLCAAAVVGVECCASGGLRVVKQQHQRYIWKLDAGCAAKTDSLSMPSPPPSLVHCHWCYEGTNRKTARSTHSS